MKHTEIDGKKVVHEFLVFWHEWECDGYGWVTEDGRAYLTDHGAGRTRSDRRAGGAHERRTRVGDRDRDGARADQREAGRRRTRGKRNSRRRRRGMTARRAGATGRGRKRCQRQTGSRTSSSSTGNDARTALARGRMDTDLPPAERRQALIAILMIAALKAGDTNFRLGGTPR